ncbi:MAG: hypothetical protein FWH03_06280 [Firmicutes bacterium]|nr:hypothetical protein [Bacillota bacterium]
MKKNTLFSLLAVTLVCAALLGGCFPDSDTELPERSVYVSYQGYFDAFSHNHESFRIREGQSETLEITTIPRDREGFLFAGWSLTEDGSEIVTSITLTPLEQHGDWYYLYAVFYIDTTTVASATFSHFFDIETRLFTSPSGNNLTYRGSATVAPKEGAVIPESITQITVRVHFEMQFVVAYQSAILEFTLLKEDNFSIYHARDFFTVSNQYNNTNYSQRIQVMSVLKIDN